METMDWICLGIRTSDLVCGGRFNASIISKSGWDRQTGYPSANRRFPPP